MSLHCGIYLITHTGTGKIYVGQSVDIKRRWWSHGSGKDESCPKLHRAMKKHGKDTFIYIILEECSQDQLTKREQFYLDTLAPFGKRGYNIATEARPGASNKGHPNTGRAAAGQDNCNNVRVCQYDDTGKLLFTFCSIIEAAQTLDINYMGIINCTKGRSRTAGGFFWSYEGTLPVIRPRGTRLGQNHTEKTKRKIGEGNKNAWIKSRRPQVKQP